uniref:xyloglucan:xyloglucosyl transferase n=1 Tax=Setaria viridis TaxID=4556 RepID=A0A4U6TVV1_SETVI|nr:hypothetical protein SEVIR_7G239100v2 [Setaria viridis]
MPRSLNALAAAAAAVVFVACLASCSSNASAAAGSFWSVDGVPVRVFRNHEPAGVPYLSGQAMRVHGSLWNGESWATEGGRVKTNWSAAPFVTSYGGYASSACVVPASGGGGCPPNASSSPGDAGAWMGRQLGPEGVAWAREKYMIYDYCDDRWRFRQGPPAECNLDRLG